MQARICETLEVNGGGKLSTNSNLNGNVSSKRTGAAGLIEVLIIPELTRVLTAVMMPVASASQEDLRKGGREARGSKSAFLPENRSQRSHHPDNMLISSDS